MNKAKKVIILDKINSPSIVQAIFILRDGVEESDFSAVQEAERIINEYLKHKPLLRARRKYRLAIMVLLVISVILFAVYWAFI